MRLISEHISKFCHGCVLPQVKSSPHLSSPCPSRPRNAIVRPAVKPPPIPAYAVEQRKPKAQIKPDTSSSQGQYSPQAYTQSSTPFKPAPLTEQKQNRRAPPPPSGPTPLPSLHPKTHPLPSTAPKPRPDPPNRPPPPCPVNKPSVVNIFL